MNLHFKSREEFKKYCIHKLNENNWNGTIVAKMGAGKSAVAIEAIKQGGFKNILITSPRSNLKESWRKELERWGIIEDTYNQYFTNESSIRIRIVLENIQTCYKWYGPTVDQFDLIIADEIHTMLTDEYHKILVVASNKGIPIIGLTGTPDNYNLVKLALYIELCPILVEYYNTEEDGLTNKKHYWIYEYELSDRYKIITSTKKMQWQTSELRQYEYLSKQYELAKNMMYSLGANDYFIQSLLWMREGNPSQKEAGRKFFYAVKNRKEFLWKLNSSLDIALQMKYKILSKPENKVLLFSEFTEQTERLSPYAVHSKTDKTAKKSTLYNQTIIDKFNSGEIREMAAVRTLELGLNLVGANWAIFESYNSSDTSSKQKGGRLNRLDINEIANIVIIVPKNTQAEKWFQEAFSDVKEFKIINNLNNLIV